jgi:hypothetical protein
MTDKEMRAKFRNRGSRGTGVYKILREEFEELVYAQHGECAICSIYKGDTLDLDHDHASGKRRDLLCRACNIGLGQFGDDIDTLEKAVKYLEFHGKKRSIEQHGKDSQT